MDMATGINRARLPPTLRARLDTAEAESTAATDLPLAPFPPRPRSPTTMASDGDDAEAEEQSASEMGVEEGEYAPSDSAMALLFEDDARPDVYVGIDADPANAPLLPMPSAVPPPSLGGCEPRHCRFHAVEGVHEHRPSDRGLRQAVELDGVVRAPSVGECREGGELGRTHVGWTSLLCPVG